MKISSKLVWVMVAVSVLAVMAPDGFAKKKAAASKSTTVAGGDPYVGAIVVNAADGKVLFEDKADTPCMPASTLKLMDMLIILEKIDQGAIKTNDLITVSAEVSKIGGSQVYLKEGESFPVEDLLYALMIQSANDAATALAIHVAGSKEGFVDLMNKRAEALGMKNTQFNSVHGLPPGKEQQADITTPRDFALLCQELLKHKDILRYTSVKERPFRDGKMIMRTHNHLLSTVPGCDGLKTGYFRKAGYSIAATAERNGQRVIAIVMGSNGKKTRDAKTAELINKGFIELATPAAAQPPTPAAPAK